MSTRTRTNAEPALPRNLGGAIAHEIRTPLAALRATLESLAREVGDQAETADLLKRALDQVAAVDRGAEALAEFVFPSPLRPLDCSLGEIVRGALAALDPEPRGRVWVAIEDAGSAVLVDGPVLVRALHSLLAAAASRRGEVLLHAHAEPGEIVFAIFDDLPEGARAGAEEPLDMQLARRDLARLGGEILPGDASTPHRLVLVRVPWPGGGRR